MRTGCRVGKCTTQLFLWGKCMPVLYNLSSCTFRFLRNLIPQFNELTQKELINSLLPKADGNTVVDMKVYFTNISLLAISQVRERLMKFRAA